MTQQVTEENVREYAGVDILKLRLWKVNEFFKYNRSIQYHCLKL